MAFAAPASNRPMRRPSSRSRGPRGGRGVHAGERTFAPPGGLCSRPSHPGGHNFEGVDDVRASGGTTPETGGEMKRGQSRRLMLALLAATALVAASARAWLARGGRRRLRSGSRGDAGRKRDPADRHDELHRLVQPLELHRGPGPERDDHGVPAARPGRLLEEGGLLHRRRLGEVVEGLSRTARPGRSSCGRTRSGPTAGR